MQRRGKHAYPMGVLAVCGTQKRWLTVSSAAEKVLVVGKSQYECVQNESSAVPEVPMAQVQQLLLHHNEGLRSAPCYEYQECNVANINQLPTINPVSAQQIIP